MPGLLLAMRRAPIVLIAVSSCLLVCGPLQGLRDTPPAGLSVHATAPEFSLTDQFGQGRTLESLMGPQGMVLVFFRSADW